MRQLKENIYSVGAIDWDRRLFDELIPLPDGTSYNAYLVKGSDKTALIDSVDPTKSKELMDNIVEAGVGTIDYVICQHGEQDHSGSVPDVLLLHPEAKVVTNKKCSQMLMDLLHIEAERFIVIEDGEVLSLGDKTLEFIFTPWVHWPETLSTYLKEDKILFSCDFFGAHLATSDLFVKDKSSVCNSAKRYYGEIMMPFRGPIRKNIERLEGLDFQMIAPSHGPVYDEPDFIIDAYKDWVREDVKNEVVVAYVSMHNSTLKMVDHLVNALVERDVEVKRYNLADFDTGEFVMDLVDAATLVIGTPQVLAGVHPLAAYAAMLVNALRPKTKFMTTIGSYGWSGSIVKTIGSLVGNVRAEVLEGVYAKGSPREEDFVALDKLADNILVKHKELVFND